MPNPVPPDTWHPPLPLPASDGVDEVAAAHAPSPVDDGIDALVVSQDQQRQNAAVASMNAAKTMDPERTGKAMELALRYGISPDLANREYELLSGQRRFDDNLDAADFTQLYKERPELAKWLLRPENAAVADGDVQYLKDVNDHVAAYVRATTDPRAKMPWLSYLTTKYTTGLGETAMPVVATLATLGAIPKDWFYGIVDREQAMAKAEAEGFQPPTGAMRVISPTLNFMGDPLSLLPMALGAKLAVKGVRATQALKDAAEIGSAAFGKIEAAAAAKGAAAGMGAQAFGQSLVSSSLATGQKPGAPEYSEALAQGTLATLFGRVMGLPVPARMAGVGGGAVGADALRQGATMAAQNVAALFPPMLTGKPAPTTGEMWMQALIGGTSGVALGIGNLPSAWAHGQAVERINRTIEAHQSLGAMDSIQAAIKAATDSATLKRSSSATEDLIRQVAAQQGAAGGLTLEQSSKSLWFPAKEIDTYLRGKGVSDPAATLEGMGVEKKAYEQAMGTGSKVEVPIEKLIVQLAKDGTAAEVLPMASIGPDRKSFAEESDWLKGLPENLAKFKEQVRGEIKTDPFATPDGKEIYQDWYQRLREIGKGSEEAKTQALFLQRGFEIAAGKYNQGEGKKIAPADLYKHLGMQIQRVLPDVLANPQIRKLMDEPLTALRVAAQKGEIPENLQGLSKALKQAGIDISKHKTNQEVFDALHQGMAAQQGAGEHLVDGRPIVKAHIPYGGGWSRDGNHLYIDERIPRYMDIDGKPVDVHALIARHEIVEKGEMDKGMKYKDAHKIATNAEHDEARSLGVNPKSYERALAPLLKQVKASSDKAKIPIDLDSRTYNQSEEGHLIKGAKGDPLKLMHTEQVAKVQMQGDERIAIKSYEQTSGEGPPRGSITFGPMSSIIKLYMGENLSTLIHEESHVLFNVFGKLAGMDDAPTDLKADWGALLKHIGAKDTESMTERQHEQLAEEMEHYLMEGKVPGQELRSAFQRIKSWMVQVYRSIKDIYRSSGGVPMLNDEVRGIFDRMLASEDEIAAAHNKLSDGPIFKDATAAGMTQAEFTDYNKRWAHGDADARDSLYEDMREQMMAPRTKVYEKALASAHEEAISNLNHDKAIAAVRHLQDGVRPDGEKSFPFPFKLDKNQLVKEYGEGILKELPGKATYSTNPNNHGEPVYASAGGLYLQSACDFLGFKSTDELVQALKGARDLSATADVMAHDKLRTQFPDMYMDGDLDKAAVEKIHGEELAALHEADTKRLADMAGKQVVPRAIMKSMAKQAVGDMKPVDIKPGLYESAEARANKESLKAMSKGDFATAMAEREKSQINRELFKAAVGAKEEANDIHDNLVRFDKPKVREAIARGGGKEFLDQIDQLREGVALKSRSQMQAAEPIPSLGQFELKQLHKGIPIAIPPDVLMEPPQKHWTDLTLNELRGLNDALSNLEGTAKNLAEAVAKQRAAALKIKSDILSGALLENRGWSVYGPEGKARIFKHYATKDEAEAAAAKIPGATTEQTRVDRGAGTAPLSGLTRTIGDYWDKLKRPTDLVYRIQGHREAGPLFDMWSKPLNEAMDVQRVMTEHAYDILMKDLDKLSKLGFDNVGAIKLNQREAIPEIRDSLNKYAQFSVALNWGNAGNRERLLAGHHWTEDQVNAILDRLDDEDWDFVEAKWKQLASYKPQIEALERRVHPGREVKWVDATPFKTKTGREVSGGYYPIVYDNGRTPPPIHEMPDAMAKSMMEGFGYSHAMTDTGHVQARTGSQDRPLKLDIGVVDDHIGKVIHDLAMREVVIDLNQLVNNGQFKDTMVNAWGKGAWDAFNDQVHAVAHGPGLDDTGLGRILEFMRNGLNASMRSFNIAYSLKQVVGAPSSIARVGFGNWSRALIQVLTPGKAQWALDNSTELRLRNAERGTYLGDAFRRTGTLAFMEPFKNTAYLFANKAWHFLDTHAWLAGYNKAMDMPEVGGDHAKACAMANQIMIDTQGGFIGKDMAQALRGNAYNKIFTNMMSWGNANLGLMVNSMHRLADKHYTPEAAAHMVSDMLLYLVVAPAAYYAGSQVITGDDMSEWKDPKKLAGRLAKESAYTGFSGIPLARDAVSWISEGKRAELPQGLGGVGAIANFGTAVRNDIAHEMEGTEPHWAPTLRQGLKVGGVLTHFPSTQVLHMLDYYFYAEQHGKNVLSPRLLLGPPPKP
jgi:hypothetical protein